MTKLTRMVSTLRRGATTVSRAARNTRPNPAQGANSATSQSSDSARNCLPDICRLGRTSRSSAASPLGPRVAVLGAAPQIPPTLAPAPRIETTIAWPELNRVDEEEEGQAALPEESTHTATPHSPARSNAGEPSHLAGLPASPGDEGTALASPPDLKGKGVRRDSFTSVMELDDALFAQVRDMMGRLGRGESGVARELADLLRSPALDSTQRMRIFAHPAMLVGGGTPLRAVARELEADVAHGRGDTQAALSAFMSLHSECLDSPVQKTRDRSAAELAVVLRDPIFPADAKDQIVNQLRSKLTSRALSHEQFKAIAGNLARRLAPLDSPATSSFPDQALGSPSQQPRRMAARRPGSAVLSQQPLQIKTVVDSPGRSGLGPATPGGGRLSPAPSSGRLSPAWSATGSARFSEPPVDLEAFAKLLAGPRGRPVTMAEFEQMKALSPPHVSDIDSPSWRNDPRNLADPDEKALTPAEFAQVKRSNPDLVNVGAPWVEAPEAMDEVQQRGFGLHAKATKLVAIATRYQLLAARLEDPHSSAASSLRDVAAHILEQCEGVDVLADQAALDAGFEYAEHLADTYKPLAKNVAYQTRAPTESHVSEHDFQQKTLSAPKILPRERRGMEPRFSPKGGWEAALGLIDTLTTHRELSRPTTPQTPNMAPPNSASSAWASANMAHDFHALDALNDLDPESFKRLSSERLAASTNSSPGGRVSGERVLTPSAGALVETPESLFGAPLPQGRTRPGHVRSHSAPSIIISEHREGDPVSAGIDSARAGDAWRGIEPLATHPEVESDSDGSNEGLLFFPGRTAPAPQAAWEPQAQGAAGQRDSEDSNDGLLILPGRAAPTHGAENPVEKSDSEGSDDGLFGIPLRNRPEGS
jgi:hypothetical protein